MKTAEDLLRQLVQSNCGCCDVREAKEYLAKTGETVEPVKPATPVESKSRRKPVYPTKEVVDNHWMFLPGRVQKALLRENVTSYAELLSLPRKELASIHGLGIVGLSHIAWLYLHDDVPKGSARLNPPALWQFLAEHTMPDELWDEFGPHVPAELFCEAIRVTVRNCDRNHKAGMTRYCATVLTRWETEGKW